ncbi:hypothetical protein XAR_3420 [Xanthomonas citri pv. glycines str. 8ra]|nr:hypothetical protein XAR_3420 [Xanthomonas citri pv. glycines str. 8ra]
MGSGPRDRCDGCGCEYGCGIALLVTEVLYLSVTEEHGASFSPRESACCKQAPIRPSGTFPRKRGKQAARQASIGRRARAPLPPHALEPLSRWRERGWGEGTVAQMSMGGALERLSRPTHLSPSPAGGRGVGVRGRLRRCLAD